jgi:hypothetical protein
MRTSEETSSMKFGALLVTRHAPGPTRTLTDAPGAAQAATERTETAADPRSW